jgi:hypothetical protein
MLLSEVVIVKDNFFPKSVFRFRVLSVKLPKTYRLNIILLIYNRSKVVFGPKVFVVKA